MGLHQEHTSLIFGVDLDSLMNPGALSLKTEINYMLPDLKISLATWCIHQLEADV